MSERPLLVKLSSLGDVAHTLVALDDLAARDLRVDWVVEEAFVELARGHPAVDRVWSIALRRWRTEGLTGLRELRRFAVRLRAARYERAIDAQGLLKSAFVARLTGARRRDGLDRRSAREGIAAWGYTHRHAIPRGHAVDRLRLLFGAALGYRPTLEAAVGVARADRANDGDAVLLHGTAWASKLYPEALWIALARELLTADRRVTILSGTADEYARARRIAAQAAGAQALAPEPLGSAMARVRSAGVVVGVDTGLTHIAAAAGVPTVGLYGPTSAELTGLRGARAVTLQSDLDCAPCLQRGCTHPAFADDRAAGPPCFARLDSERILAAVTTATCA
ncbi:MAG: lipopolysaccharide heptosyltransferase I [Pseudomonadota bacterium]